MILDMIEIIAFAIIMLLLASLIVSNIYLRLQNNKLKASLTQETIDRSIVLQKIQDIVAELDKKNSAQNDGFLKFVSDSREAAFKYIEEVQAAISEFDKKLGPVVKHYKETGKVLEKRPTEIVKNVTEAYDKLMNSMPKDSDV